jgi:hypothetical protein
MQSMVFYKISALQPSVLALALVMSELKQLANVDWLGVCVYLQHVAQASVGDCHQKSTQ